MNRRKFLQASLAAGAGLALAPRGLLAAAPRAPRDTVLLTLNLQGGPDFRHVFVPPYDPTNPYSAAFWPARAMAHLLDPDDAEGLEARSNAYVLPQEEQFQHFRINPNCGWLRSMFDQGNVAIINNVYASANRNHPHSVLMLESGDTEAGAAEIERSGWGGRLADACDRNIVSVTRSVRSFCYGPHATDPLGHDNARVVAVQNSRTMGLHEFAGYEGDWQLKESGYMSRSLSSYYAAKAEALPQGSRFRQIVQHEQSQREFGRLMKESLFGQLIGDSLEGVVVPEEIAGLFTEHSPYELQDHDFGGQIRNIYDVMHARDVLDANIISAEYRGWDHHRKILNGIEGALADVFGTGGGLDTLFTQLGPKADDIVILLYGEFGRQLAANGDHGVDHGVANSMLLIGKQVNGGVHGDLFPESEVARFQLPGADIEGRTSFKQVLGRVCEKLRPGSAEAVLPGWRDTDLEDGVSLDNLFG